MIPSDRESDNECKLKFQKIPCECQNIFYYELFAPWNRLPREAMVTPSFEILRT